MKNLSAALNVMIDRNARNELAAAIERLVSGEMTNDEFDNGYFERWSESADPAVFELAGFGWSLYDDMRAHPYRLEGGDAVSEAARHIADHALLFLQTDREYEWPQDVFGVRRAKGAALIWVRFWLLCYVCAGFTLSVLWILRRAHEPLFVNLLWLGGLSAVINLIIAWARRTERKNRFLSTGDFNSTWPFLGQADIEAALREPTRTKDGGTAATVE
jgi:hypothetical protein